MIDVIPVILAMLWINIYRYPVIVKDKPELPPDSTASLGFIKLHSRFKLSFQTSKFDTFVHDHCVVLDCGTRLQWKAIKMQLKHGKQLAAKLAAFSSNNSAKRRVNVWTRSIR